MTEDAVSPLLAALASKSAGALDLLASFGIRHSGRPVTGLSYNVDISRPMDETSAIEALSALAQPTRLAVFRELAAAYPDEVPAGDIARTCKVPHNTMSSHLAILTRAGLTTARRDGRAIRYRASLDRLRDLIAFLARDCCDGHPELCLPLAADLSRSCAQKRCGVEVENG